MEGKELNKELICKTLGQGDDKKKYYVYMLCDAKNKPFYIGKGEGGRIWQHEEDAHKKEEEIKNKIDEEVNKLEEKLDKNLTKPQKEQQKKFFRERLGKELKGNNDKIKKINSLGKDVTKVIVKWGLTNDEAYMVESALINMYKFIGGKNSLTNIANGHMSKKEKENRYCKTEVQTLQSFATNCVEPEKSLTDILKAYFGKSYTKKTAKDGCGILFVKINNFYPMCEAIENAADKDAAIRDAASGFWNVAENRIKNIEYVFALYQSQIVGIYYVKNATWVRKRK